jgi:hypothetical protein
MSNISRNSKAPEKEWVRGGVIIELTRARRTFLGDRLEEEGHTRNFEAHSIAEVVLASISINLLKEVVILKALFEFHHGLAH